MQVLGIPGFAEVKAEALDLAGRDVAAIMPEAEAQAVLAARQLAKKLG